jgi:D-lactate dehydrogenase
MRIAFFSTHDFEKDFLIHANQNQHELTFISARLDKTTVALATGYDVVSIFTSDDASATVLDLLYNAGVNYIALRCAGFNRVDLDAANALGIKVARVPAYSPYAIAEHAVALMMALNRNLITAHNRVREMNFSLNGLIGFDMNGKTVGIVGMGKIGMVLSKILQGFNCNVIAYDPYFDPSLTEKQGVIFNDFETLCKQADIISLHAPLTEETKHLICKETIAKMKPGVMLINTSRGGLVCTKDVVDALKSRQIGAFGMDVYEEEDGLFFEDHSDDILQDDIIARLMTFKNVLITSHQAFLTKTALENIAITTFENINSFELNLVNPNQL